MVVIGRTLERQEAADKGTIYARAGLKIAAVDFVDLQPLRDPSLFPQRRRALSLAGAHEGNFVWPVNRLRLV